MSLLQQNDLNFTGSKGTSVETAKHIEEAVATRLGVSARVTVLTGKDIVAAVRDNPLASVADDPSRLLLLVPAHAKAVEQLKPLLRERWAPEALSIGSRIAYL